MTNGMKLKGHYTVEAFDAVDGRALWVRDYDNLITDGFYTALWAQLNAAVDSPASGALNLAYIALGDGTTAPAAGDTGMESEKFRKAISSKVKGAYKFTCKLSLSASEGNGNINEVGVFAGPSASSAAGSGLMVSHCAANFVKNSNIKLVITWTLTAN